MSEMDERTRVALLGAIAKWEGIVRGEVRDLGSGNCELCRTFYDNEDYDDDGNPDECLGCPVRERSGWQHCKGTPYGPWAMVAGYSQTADTPERRAAAQAELNFLRSLLPEAS